MPTLVSALALHFQDNRGIFMRLTNFWGASAAALAAATAVSSVAYAQETTGTIRGFVTDSAGNAVSGAEVTVTNTLTGSSTTVETGNSGIFSVRGLSVAGDYSVRVVANDFPSQRVDGIRVSVGDTSNVNFALQSGAATDEIVVTASRSSVIKVATGPSATFDLSDINSLPTISRDIKDIIRTDPRIVIDETFGDGIFCVGTSNRSNSLTVDGVRQNDDFGLNGNGYPTQGLPFPFDVAQQIAAEIAPFDVEYGQFTGCNINVVTRSGSNDFTGRGFVDWSPEGLNGSTLEDGSITVADDPYELKYGGFVSGPILKDRLFFLFGAERFETVGTAINDGPSDSSLANRAAGITQADLDSISGILGSTYGYDTLGFTTDIAPVDRSFFGKIDAVITDDHRLEFSVQDTNSNRLSTPELNANGNELSFAGFWYNQNEKLRTYSGRLFSNWNDQLSTEIRVSHKDQSSSPTTLGDPSFAQLEIQTAGDGIVFAGTEQFRHANRLSTEVFNIKAKAEYQAGNHLFKFGYERDDLDVFNLFVFASNGVAEFNNVVDDNGTPDDTSDDIILSTGIDALAAQTPSNLFYRNAPTNIAEDAAADWDRVLNTIYVQDDWQIHPSFLLTLGLRYDWYNADAEPTLNTNFQGRYGFPNDTNLQGLSLIQPRVGFDWTVSDRLRLTGGVGVYSGGDPAVWVSNAFSNNGLAIGDEFATSGLAGFDGVNIPGSVQAANTAAALAGTGGVDVTDPDYEITSITRVALGAQYDADLSSIKLGENWTFGGDFLYTRTNNPNEWRNLSLARVGIAPDGRPIYQGRDALDPDCPAAGPGAASNPTDGVCGVDVRQDYLLTNSPETPVSYTVSAFMKKEFEWSDNGGGSFDFGYAFTDSQDVNPGTSSRAVSNFENFSSRDVNFSPAARSNYSIKHAFTARLDLEHEFFAEAPTKITFFGLLQSGRPFSYNFDTPGTDGDPSGANLFGDSDASEDRQLLYVPAGPGATDDPVVRYDAGFDLAAFNAFLAESGLDEYRGRIAPRNAFSSDWYGKVDMRFQQTIPSVLDHRLTLVVDIRNLTNLINDSWGVYREVGFEYNAPVVDATIDGANNQFVYTNFDGAPTQRVNTNISAWDIQFGLRYDF